MRNVKRTVLRIGKLMSGSEGLKRESDLLFTSVVLE